MDNAKIYCLVVWY